MVSPTLRGVSGRDMACSLYSVIDNRKIATASSHAELRVQSYTIMMATFNSLERERERVRERGFVMTQTSLLAKISGVFGSFCVSQHPAYPACPMWPSYVMYVHVHACTCMCMMSVCVHVQCMHVCVKSGECVMGINNKEENYPGTYMYMYVYH